eukprot:CAMPEP_0180527596 /NCGR_PEP_ID=MMETSP1036_2-20121128/60321_1 /TAXON_ID=632150 /ORGANISM="Azadinium spinosum, Strain 3D9" /LENGTH=77 /DNA_ID=CAMNT_0022541043 /DNA_START=84 /DNA_END=318 /DNA_ORIENTATION=-
MMWPTVDARAAIVAATVEPVPEKVLEDRHLEGLHTTKLLIHQSLHRHRRLVDRGQLVQGLDDRCKDPRHLGVLVDEH